MNAIQKLRALFPVRPCWTGSVGKLMEENRRSFRAVLWIIGILGILALGCSEEKPDSRAETDPSQGFTFFDLGANSKSYQGAGKDQSLNL